MKDFKIILFIICFVFSIFMFTGVVSAATLNLTEVEHASTSVKNYTESTTDIPRYVVVSNKNSTAPSFLKTITTWTTQLNNGVTTLVTISSVNNPTGPSGSATGTLPKSEYLTIANNIKNYITSNGRAPNYASSTLGNIRYESLIYAYSKILDFYKTNGRLPNSVSVVNIVGVSGGVIIPPLDYTPPTVTADPVGGVYTSSFAVTLTATDNCDPNPSIYYTTDGTTPTTSSTLYTNSITIYNPGNTILKFIARDTSGNQAAVQTITYTINLITDITTGISYSTIQNAINDASTLNGDIIELQSGVFIEDIVINKKLTIKAANGSNPILQSPDSTNVITINSNGNGTTIQGLTLNGSGIFLHDVSNCTISGNTININNTNENGIASYGASNSIITGNTVNYADVGIWLTYDSNNNNIQNNSISNSHFDAIRIDNSNDNLVQNNTVTHNGRNGIYLWYSDNNTIQDNIATFNNAAYNYSGINVYNSSNNTIKNNTIYNNGMGLYLGYNSNNTVRKNTITNNEYGIYIMNSSDKIHYNNIYGNSKIGLINNGEGTSNAAYNWWGHSSTPTQGSADGNDYYNGGVTCPINPWLLLDANTYIICNKNTQLLFTTIQDAINDSTTSPGDTIILDRTYNENITINKQINLIAENDTSPSIIGTITVNSSGNGSTIEGLTINGNITLNANNCTIIDNIIIGNGISAIILNNSTNTRIADNTITSNGFNGIQSMGSSINIHDNKIYNCVNGIYSENSNNNIKNNTIINNNCGIYTYNSTDTIQFNRITQNIYGLKNEISTINATNNWWGSNNDPSTSPISIYNISGNVTYNPWLVLNVSSNPPSFSNRNYTITADLTHDNNGNDTSPQGTIPDGIPINFTTTFGTLETPVYTNKGKSISSFNSNGNGVANVTVTLDNQNMSTIINLGVYNGITGTGFTTIQDAINASSDGDIIIIYIGTYNENLIINNKLTLASDTDTNPILNGSITINSGGDGSKIQGLTINGNINLYVNNCSIYGNTIYSNETHGILTSNSSNNTIFKNIITSNGFDGIHSSYSNNNLYGNTIYGCESGIYSEYSNDTITSNNLTNNYYGIWTHNSTDAIQFNRITQNTYGLRNDIGTVNATNNWWGSNNDPSTITNDIYITSGTVNYNPWLILSSNVSSTNSGGNTSVTADLTHNSNGGDTSSQGYVPNGIPVNFATNYGNIISSSYTVKGRATTILNLGSTQNATVTTTASLDNETISTTGVITTGIAVLNITSTAIDSSTGQTLNITYNIPLNESVTWLSIMTIPIDPCNYAPADDLQVIIDGNIVLEKTIYTNNSLATDTLTVTLNYPGVSGFNITITDPDNNTNVTTLNFPGNIIQRTSPLKYIGSPCDILRSFAIATTNISSDILQYWLNQNSNYQSDTTMNASYNAFISCLMVEYIHDQLADDIADQFDVIWSRTSPIIVSICEDYNEIYITLDCDQSMGMTVIGTTENMIGFNFITSSSIPSIEYAVMSNTFTNGNFCSVTMDLINYLNNNISINRFEQNGYMIVKFDNDYLVIDRS